MKAIPIESVLDIYDPRILWADIGHDYKGYQISNTGLIRSMKFYKKYPFGILLTPDKNGIYKLSNSLNQIELINRNDLLNCKYIFNIPTYYSDCNSRNPLVTSQSKIIKKNKEMKEKLQQPSGFHFKTID